MFSLEGENKLSIIGGAYDCNVNKWCADGYAAVEDKGLFEVVPGYQVSYYVDGDDTPVYIEGVVTGGKAKGYIHVVEAVEQGEEDNAIFKWYKEAEVQPIVFPLDIVEDTPLHGTLVPAVIVDFETGEGSEVSRQVIEADAECSRAQMAVFLSRMTGGKAQGEDFAFSDVDGSAYYANAVQWAAETGITLGTGDGLFSPDAACSRAQMVTFLLRCFNK